MSHSRYVAEKILGGRNSSRASCVVSMSGGFPAGKRGSAPFFLLLFSTFLSYQDRDWNATRNNLTSFTSGTAKSHCEPSTGDAKASAEYAVATPAIPEVIVHN